MESLTKSGPRAAGPGSSDLDHTDSVTWPTSLRGEGGGVAGQRTFFPRHPID
jgi:hypothetical protein